MIVIRNLTKSYGKNDVLKGINMEFDRGKVYGIVGKNGAGKTTLFRCIAGLENYDGAIDSDHKPLKNYLGFLPTNPIFMSRITAWEYLKLLCVARDIKEERFDDQNIFELPLQRYAEIYSTGMKKKLALMGVLLQKNEIFILDEPFNGVDIHSNMIISEIINKLKSMNKVVIISSHIFSTLRNICDSISLLEDGQFKKTVIKTDFDDIEEEMKNFIVGDRLSKINIR